MTPYEQLLCYYKSAANLARLLNLHRSTVLRWKRKPIPLKHLDEIYYSSNAKLNRQILRPDLFKRKPNENIT